ncbi:hypothetical protein [Pseudomonas sp. BN606]|uniref:hypothetical protein n=1 Tax=Pseudomonas sp. BN606 TaxID=2567894 RepID=UPI0024561408|nr:hypothetical protein [Pseudomonas sp. BN606]MDH4656013.1 hypothetical protein [Pseudomonas sp. BN606]
MEVKNNAGQREYTCANCGTDYQGKKYIADKAQRFCSRSCKEKAARAAKAKAKVVSQLERWAKSSFGGYVISKCRDAGTVQIMHGHTAQSLDDLASLYSSYFKCYGWNKDERKSLYNLCHIQPHKGRDGSIGLLHPHNLFIGCSEANRRHHNKPVPMDAGLSLPASKLVAKWKVKPNATAAAIAKQVLAFLGAEFDDYLLSAGSIKLNKRHSLAQRIYNRQQKGTAVADLDRKWTLPELEALPVEELEKMDAFQKGKEVNTFRPEVYTKALLCVCEDELERLAGTGAGRHADNCRFMLPLVRGLGIYLAQLESEDVLERSHRSFMSLARATWKPLQYNMGLFWGTNPRPAMARDFGYMKETILQGAFNALQGLHVNKERFEDHLLKRLQLDTLVPQVDTPDEYSWVASEVGSWDVAIDTLYTAAEPVWNTLEHLGMVTLAQIEEARTGLLWSAKEAIDKGRRRYRAQPRFRRVHGGKQYTDWGWKGYPDWLLYPPVLVEGLHLDSEELSKVA